MVRKHLFQPTRIYTWAVVVYEDKRKFSEQDAAKVAKDLAGAMLAVGERSFLFVRNAIADRSFI